MYQHGTNGNYLTLFTSGQEQITCAKEQQRLSDYRGNVQQYRENRAHDSMRAESQSEEELKCYCIMK